MKKILAPTIMLVILHINTYACDICGCGVGGFYLGIMPNFSENIVGIRSQHQRFEHPDTYLNYNGSSRVKQDLMFRSDLWLRYYASSRLQILTFVPYQTHIRQETEHSAQISGIGDIRFRALYTIVNTGDSIAGKFKHTLLAGGEVKLPTGPYQQRDPVRLQIMPELFQIGTGGYGFSGNLMYTIRYKSVGFTTDFMYTTNTTNERLYRWGDQVLSSSRLFYWKNFGRQTLMPSIGISYEHFNPDTYQFRPEGTVYEKNGGTTTWLQFGLDFYAGRWMFQLFSDLPVQLNLPEGMPAGTWRTGFNVGLFF